MVLLGAWVTAPFSDTELDRAGVKILVILGVSVILQLVFFLGLSYAAAFLQKLYAVQDHADAFWRLADMVFDLSDLMFHSLLGTFLTLVPTLFGFELLYVVVREGRVDSKYAEKAVAKIGGPAYLIIYGDSAVVLERDGQFTRVLGAGFQSLERFETIRAVIDLRPQVRRNPVRALTREGIPIRLDLEIEYQIQPWSLPPQQQTANVPRTFYPFREDAVRRAAYNVIVDQGQVYRWDEITWLLGRVFLRRLLRQRVMDRLLEPEEGDMHAPLPREKSPRWELQTELQRRLQPVAHEFGVTVLRITLGVIRIDPESVTAAQCVEKERIQVWQAEWQKRIRLLEQEAEAEAMRLKETARAQAQADMITAIAHGLPADLDEATAQRIIALRVLQSLEEMSVDPSARRFLPEEAIRALQNFHRVLQERSL